MATMAGYLVLMFFAAQFVAYFAWSNLGIIFAIHGAQLLTELNAPAPVMLVAFILIAATINLFVGSGGAKWALLAPVFIPMLMLVGIAPETTQVAFRIGVSVCAAISQRHRHRHHHEYDAAVQCGISYWLDSTSGALDRDGLAAWGNQPSGGQLSRINVPVHVPGGSQ